MNEKKKKIIRIQQEIFSGPLFYCNERGIVTGHAGLDVDPPKEDDEFLVFKKDKELNELAEEIANMFTSYYEFDSHDEGCWFNEEQQKKDKNKMLDLLKRLRKRVDELNDGRFIIEDKATRKTEEL